MFLEDEKFLTELFNQLTDEDTDENQRKELVLFLKEFFSFSTTLQPQARETFFKTLNSLGVLQAMEVTLASENKVRTNYHYTQRLMQIRCRCVGNRGATAPHTFAEFSPKLLQNEGFSLELFDPPLLVLPPR